MLFLLGTSDGITEVVYDTLMQIAAPASMRAGAFAIASAINNVGMAVGFGAAAVVAAMSVSPHAAMVAAAAVCLGGAPFALAILLGGRRRSTAGEVGAVSGTRPPVDCEHPQAVGPPSASSSSSSPAAA
jgi:hypothetical protein